MTHCRVSLNRTFTTITRIVPLLYVCSRAGRTHRLVSVSVSAGVVSGRVSVSRSAVSCVSHCLRRSARRTEQRFNSRLGSTIRRRFIPPPPAPRPPRARYRTGHGAICRARASRIYPRRVIPMCASLRCVPAGAVTEQRDARVPRADCRGAGLSVLRSSRVLPRSLSRPAGVTTKRSRPQLWSRGTRPTSTLGRTSNVRRSLIGGVDGTDWRSRRY